MNKDVTAQLGGLQNITQGCIQPGDKVTFTHLGERCIEPVEHAPEILLGMDIGAAEHLFDVKVYRSIEVPRPGDLDHDCPDMRGTMLGGSAGPKPLTFQEDVGPEHYIPQDSAERKSAPMFRGLLGYFPAALFEVARHSLDSEKKHNPGGTTGPNWYRGKSHDHADCIVRHLIDAGDHNTPDRLVHLRSLAWRALAVLQEECELQGAKPGVSSIP